LWKSNDKSIFALDLLNSDISLLKAIPVLFLTSAALAFVAIFLFKNRKLQFVIGRLTILINLILLGLLMYVSLTLPGEAAVSEKGIGMFVPILAVLLLVLANKAIKKDEDLVKSADRLR
jgi:peptidoglycan/LPS O-acetylase OafA/YrhL